MYVLTFVLDYTILVISNLYSRKNERLITLVTVIPLITIIIYTTVPRTSNLIGVTVDSPFHDQLCKIKGSPSHRRELNLRDG